MTKKFAIYWPGDYRKIANKAALPEVTQATIQLEHALKKLGYISYRVEGFITKPNEAIKKLGLINDPLIGIYTHWVYGPHTTDGIIGKNNPLLLVSNFSKKWPGLVGLLNTASCLTSLGKLYSRIWTAADEWYTDQIFIERLDAWCRNEVIIYPLNDIFSVATVNIDQKAKDIADNITKEIKN